MNFCVLKQIATAQVTFFGSTYISEQTFLVLNLNKSKIRNRIADENISSVLCIATTNLKANMKSITSDIQSVISLILLFLIFTKYYFLII